MKKIYNAPVARVHTLQVTNRFMDMSMQVDNTDENAVSASESLTNEQTETTTSLWDEQW